MKYREWIPVTERLPDIRKACLFLVDNEVVYLGDMVEVPKDEFDYTWRTGNFIFQCTHVTHWMPLPEPPNNQRETGVLQTTYETPETCPNCMEHLSLEWAFCPECGRPTNWNKSRKTYDCIEGMCCDCQHGNGHCCDYSENADCEYQKEDGSCWEAYTE